MLGVDCFVAITPPCSMDESNPPIGRLFEIPNTDFLTLASAAHSDSSSPLLTCAHPGRSKWRSNNFGKTPNTGFAPRHHGGVGAIRQRHGPATTVMPTGAALQH